MMCARSHAELRQFVGKAQSMKYPRRIWANLNSRANFAESIGPRLRYWCRGSRRVRIAFIIPVFPHGDRPVKAAQYSVVAIRLKSPGTLSILYGGSLAVQCLILNLGQTGNPSPSLFARPYGPWPLSPAAKGFCLHNPIALWLRIACPLYPQKRTSVL
jgi:hypothetical protein